LLAQVAKLTNGSLEREHKGVSGKGARKTEGKILYRREGDELSVKPKQVTIRMSRQIYIYIFILQNYLRKRGKN